MSTANTFLSEYNLDKFLLTMILLISLLVGNVIEITSQYKYGQGGCS